MRSAIGANDWVVVSLRTWAAQWHAIDSSDASLPSVLGRIKAQREGAHSGGPVRQVFPEVYRGDGLLVQRALHFGDGVMRETAAAHYLVPPPPRGPTARVKAELLGLSVRTYWVRVDGLHSYLAGWLARETASESF